MEPGEAPAPFALDAAFPCRPLVSMRGTSDRSGHTDPVPGVVANHWSSRSAAHLSPVLPGYFLIVRFVPRRARSGMLFFA